ncbi:MAG: type VI secretion system protein TssA [Gammaproteobacteria bacterium HGW-Gammaproteobacteria-8]|nr:MAG: type VI secretion system protein TssA [Gammaproteobacteria bacterium HGW-Gammaproteobacteria-8]
MSELLNIEKLAAALDEQHPCGEGLEDFVFDPDYAELERLAQGKPEQVMGDETIPAEEPDWRAVQDKALALFERVRSLRVAVLLTKALCTRQGLAGLCAGLALIDRLQENWWDEVEPLIDDGDATERLHTLAELASEQGLLPLIRQSELVRSPAIGRYTIRDFLIASNKLSASKHEESATLTSINQALMDCDLEFLQATLAFVDEAAELAGSIETRFNQNVSASALIDLDPFTRLFGDIRPALQEVLGRRGIAVESSGESNDGDVSNAGSAAVPAASGEIRSREDVVRMLDRITEYYNRNEPSSPVPLLVQRAKRLVAADFMAIIKDIASDGYKQADVLLGGPDDD